MKGTRRNTYIRFLLVFAVVGSLGLVSTAYILVQQRAALPFANVYEVRAEFAAADGVIAGLGQPVNVAGVKVGQVTDVGDLGGSALVTMEIQRGLVSEVHSNATAMLEPITPLEDMQVALDPGGAPAPALAPGGVISLAQTNRPVPLSDLLSSLDGDTRTYLGSLISAFDQGTRGQGPDLRRMLLALGPTAEQVGRINQAVASRRQALARLVHNLGTVTRAASRDQRLGQVVVAGNRAVSGFAEQDQPLQAALTKLPATLEAARSTLEHIQPFARELGPTVDKILPPVRDLPGTLRDLRPFARSAAGDLRQDIRPLLREAEPLVRDLPPSVKALSSSTPKLSRSFQALQYLANELAYNPPGNDEGFLFWLSWFVHNFGSLTAAGDANGGLGRAFPLVTCYGVQEMDELQAVLGVTGLCDK